jgi:hypothetical protein
VFSSKETIHYLTVIGQSFRNKNYMQYSEIDFLLRIIKVIASLSITAVSTPYVLLQVVWGAIAFHHLIMRCLRRAEPTP